MTHVDVGVSVIDAGDVTHLLLLLYIAIIDITIVTITLWCIGLGDSQLRYILNGTTQMERH